MLFIASQALAAVAAERRHHDAHEHGSAQLNVAQDGSAVYVDFDSPAANVVGYEHLPKSAADRETLESALATLRDGEHLFVFPESADCKLEEVELTSPLIGGSDEHGHRGATEADSHSHEHEDDHHNEASSDHHHHDTQHEGPSHTDIRAVWHYKCGDPAAISQIDIRLFEAFPGTEKLQIQYITEQAQGAATVNALQPLLRF
ncbi:MAG: DUF2796 domain-containing protein [Pseudomonadota bacterium]